MATERQTFYTPEEYLAMEREAQEKSEYYSGQIYAMAGGSPEHNLIGFNIAGLLHARLRGSPCRGFTSDQRVRVTETGLYTYPDVTVVCGELQFDDARRDTLTNPALLIEILSPSTEAYDRGEKFAHYRRIESLQEYVLIAQDQPRVERFLRQSDGTWNYRAAEGVEGRLRLESVGVELLLSEVYEGVEFQNRNGEPTDQPPAPTQTAPAQ
jgi:Uma2 family endonuclease